MKRIVFHLLWLLSLPMTMLATEITQQQAMQQAQAFMQQLKGGNVALTRAAFSVDLRKAETDMQSLYVFNVDGGGYVIVSGDDRVEPIIGYSDKGTIDKNTMPCNMRFMLENYDRAIKSVIR